MTLKLDNIVKSLTEGGVIQKERIYNPIDKWRKYKLLKKVSIILSDGSYIEIPKGFDWDLSSVPRLFWNLLPPDGDFEIAALIHDYLYRYEIKTRLFSDKEMLIWSNTVNKRFLGKIDNYTRYLGVRAFGSFVWNRRNKDNE